MQKSTQKVQPNPLANLMRKPKLKVKLPSKGHFWSEGSILLSNDNEYDVFSLTARDEITLKNPSAVASGQAIASVLQSCIPSIKDGWAVPSIDVDALLIAIRIASHGNIMSAKVQIEDNEFECEVDLNDSLDQLYNLPEWDGRFEIDDMTLYLRPIPFQTLSTMGRETVETQKIMNVINDDSADEEKKIAVFKKSFSKLTDITMNFVQECVYRIDVGEESVVNTAHLKDFIENCDSSVFTAIKNKIDEMAEKHSIKPLTVNATEEMIAAGSDETVEVAVNYELSNFFSGGNT